MAIWLLNYATRDLQLGDVHTCLEFHQTLHRLLRDPRLPGKVNDIILEFGNPLFQAPIDRYVVEGLDASRAERKRAWENAVMEWAISDSPLYEAFFELVRDVNLRLPKENVCAPLWATFLLISHDFGRIPQQNCRDSSHHGRRRLVPAARPHLRLYIYGRGAWHTAYRRGRRRLRDAPPAGFERELLTDAPPDGRRDSLHR